MSGDDTIGMDDVSALQRTVRRCTAILVAAVALHLDAVAGAGKDWSTVLLVGVVLYLLASGWLEFVVIRPNENAADAAGDGGSRGDRSDRGT